jgi:hypothetical protein
MRYKKRKLDEYFIDCNTTVEKGNFQCNRKKTGSGRDAISHSIETPPMVYTNVPTRLKTTFILVINLWEDRIEVE